MKPPILIRSVTLAAFARTIIAGRPLLRSTSNNTGLSPGGLGSADIFDDSTKLSLYGKPWDRAEEHKVLIRYCYRNPTIRSSVQTFIEGGINKWKTALGERSEEKGHAVAFEEAMEPGTEPDTEQPAYCAKAGASIDEYYDDDWNPKVPFDTLVINEVTGNTGSSSTIGLGQESKPWQNILDVGLYWNYVDRALTTAHELGHVLGMAHEHQRTDRKKYIVYLCTNLRDYDAVRHQLQADNAAGRGKRKGLYPLNNPPSSDLTTQTHHLASPGKCTIYAITQRRPSRTDSRPSSSLRALRRTRKTRWWVTAITMSVPSCTTCPTRGWGPTAPSPVK
ncbi:hypothetical protein BCR34DRAFT_228307 [Clohesyomyces aquaticus]|uniref:Peptidase M12A domain-containing protein n=1 Tax=Clohesyomyces aquaticus TaxID=1231657 RepID=A0A1Y1ZWB4_9PLEO|nr:hypothetical protein BCR34DRAFT_228307 [Clohesyomyces aquaticus]